MDTNILNDYVWLLLAGIVTLVITAFKTGISSFISDRIKKFLEKVIHSEFDGKKIGEEVDFVYKRLIELKVLTASNRVSVYRFHNGTVFLPSKPAWKISRTYEVCSDGISYEAQHFQNMMAMLVWDSVKAIFENKKSHYVEKLTKENINIYKYDVSKMDESYSKVLLRRHGIKQFLQIPLIIKEKVFGYIQIDYVVNKNIDFDMNAVYSKASEISFYLGKDN